MTQALTPKEQKRLLRPECKQARQAVTQKAERSEKICRRICALPAFQSADTVLCYYGVGDEVKTDTILETALRSGKRVGVPHCYEDSRMEFLEIHALSDLTALSAFGIPEAPDGTTVIDPMDADLCLVPALAFDRNGCRIGYGKGYYDRYLKRFSGHSVGLCFDACLRDDLPINQNDRPVRQIVTERQIITLSYITPFFPEVSYGR